MLLTYGQAQAFYDALEALDRLESPFGADIQVMDWTYARRIYLTGAVVIENRASGVTEKYNTREELAAAYGLI